jgi:hypothetical protein
MKQEKGNPLVENFIPYAMLVRIYNPGLNELRFCSPLMGVTNPREEGPGL